MNLSTTDVIAENKLSLQNADNPVKNGMAQLIYPKVKNGEIRICDLSGRKMDAFKLAGENRTYQLKTNYPSGIYLVHLKPDTEVAVQKMILK